MRRPSHATKIRGRDAQDSIVSRPSNLPDFFNSLLMAGSMLGGLDNTRRHALRDEIMGTLDKLGATPAQKADVEAEWRKGVHLLYVRAIGNTFQHHREALGPKGYNDFANGFNALTKFEIWAAPTPDEIEEYFRKASYVPTDRAKKWLEDYRLYLRTCVVRDRDVLRE